MISFIITLFNSGFLLFLLNDYFKKNYPQKYEDFIIQYSFKVIYLYSKCEILYKKISNYINSNSRFNEILYYYKNNKKEENDIEFIYNNNIILKTNKNYLINKNNEKNAIILPSKFDFIIYSESNNMNEIEKENVNKLIMYTLPTESQNILCEFSNIRFILIEVSFNDNKTIKIDFLQKNENYYIVGNIVNSIFIQYFLYKYYKKELEENNLIDSFKEEEIILNIIDHNIEKKCIYFASRYIKFEKDSYEIGNN